MTTKNQLTDRSKTEFKEQPMKIIRFIPLILVDSLKDKIKDLYHQKTELFAPVRHEGWYLKEDDDCLITFDMGEKSDLEILNNQLSHKYLIKDEIAQIRHYKFLNATSKFIIYWNGIIESINSFDLSNNDIGKITRQVRNIYDSIGIESQFEVEFI